MKLFKNKNYTVLLIVGFICYFYQNAMNYYAPIGAHAGYGSIHECAGALQMPRTLITIILPTIAGAWVGKKAANAWKAMVIGTSLAMIPMAVMALVTNSGASIMIYFVALAVTGIAESFRAVSITQQHRQCWHRKIWESELLWLTSQTHFQEQLQLQYLQSHIMQVHQLIRPM